MPRVCPRPCSQLATAAVFLSVGIVQLIVGMILLRSKYAFLLAGPDFWTSCSNIAVGCLLGVSASVWKSKSSKKRQSKKHQIRHNLLLALVFSALTINATTLIILLMGDGNNLLSIRLESSEVLAYAYATSVCSPIVCIVVSIVAISGILFQFPRNKCLTDIVTPESSLQKERTQSFQWVYTPEQFDIRKQRIRQVSSESSSDESEDLPPRPEYRNAGEDLENVLHRMSLGKRDSVMSDSTIMLQELDRRRKIRYSSGIINPLCRDSLSSPRDVLMNDKIYRKNRSSYLRSLYSQRQSEGRRSQGSSGYVPMELFHRLENQTPNSSPANADDVFSDHPPSSENSRNFSFQYRKFKERLKTRPDLDNSVLSRHSLYRKGFADAPVVHKSPRMPDIDGQHLPVERQRHVQGYEPTIDYETLRQQPSKASKEVLSPVSPECFSPDGSDFADSFDFSRKGSWAGEVVPIEVKKTATAQLSQRSIPVRAPVVPLRRDSVLTATAQGVRTKEDVSVQSPNADQEKDSLVSFRKSIHPKRREHEPEYPKAEPQSTKCDLSKVMTMTSISEEASQGTYRSSSEGPQHALYNEDSSTSSSTSHDNVGNKKPLMIAQSEMAGDRSQKWDPRSLGKFKTLKRKTSVSCKRLKRIWSSNGSRRDIDILDKVVDVDSLIGLSEEELKARLTRTRSIRKAVEKRIREQELAVQK